MTIPKVNCEKHGEQYVWITGCCLSCYCDYMRALNRMEMNEMKPGTIVKLLVPDMDNEDKKGYVESGAIAEVVDGFDEFPYLYKKLEERLGANIDKFIWIRWDQRHPKWHKRVDGAYHRSRFCSIRTSRVINTGKESD
jgi:hypothetical protein